MNHLDRGFIRGTSRYRTTRTDMASGQFESCTAHHREPLKPLGFKGFCCLKTGLTLILTLKAPAHRRYAPCGAWSSPAWCWERCKARKRLRQMLHSAHRRFCVQYHCIGSSTAMVVPLSELSSTQTEPPWRSAISHTRESPSPAPPYSRLRDLSTRKKGWKILH